MKKSWWKTLLTKKSANPRIAELEQELAETRLLLDQYKGNVKLNSRRVSKLRLDHPELAKKYFSKKGLKNEL